MKTGAWVLAGAVGLAVFVIGLAARFVQPAPVILGIAGFVVVVVVAAIGGGDRPRILSMDASRRTGTRSEVAMLAWGIRADGEVSHTVMAHVRAISLAALAEAGVTLDTPEGVAAARSLVGSAWTDVLINENSTAQVTDLAVALDALERMERTR